MFGTEGTEHHAMHYRPGGVCQYLEINRLGECVRGTWQGKHGRTHLDGALCVPWSMMAEARAVKVLQPLLILRRA